MKLPLFFLVALLALCVCFASARVTFTAPECVRQNACSSKDWSIVEVAHPSSLVQVLFAVKPSDIEGLQRVANDISNPESPNYGQILTFDEVGQYIRNDQAIKAIASYLSSHKIHFQITLNGDYFKASIPVGLANKIFNTKFHRFVSKAKKGTQIIRALEYSLPEELEEHVQLVGHIISFPVTLRPTPLIQSIGNVAAPPNGQVVPAFIASYYNVSSTKVQSGSATTQSLFESLGQSFSPDDLKTFQKNFNLTVQAVKTVIGPNNGSSCPTNPNNCVEANLDVQYIMGVAEGAQTTYWSVDSNGDIFLNWIVAVANTTNPPLVHSISYGSIEPEEVPSELQQFDQEALKLGARGVTIMSSSGDDGVANFQARENPSACGFTPSFPATATNVVAVGATQGPESGNPEVMCSSLTGGIITSGGGFSSVFTSPDYQAQAVAGYMQANVSLPPSNMYNTKGRGYPDVALLGYNYYVVIGGQGYGVSGTSCSSPTFAALVSLINDARHSAGKKSLGLLNQVLYSLGASNPSVFRDVTVGENNCCAAGFGSPVCCQYGFNATKGWDPTTGFGSVNFDALSAALLSLP